MKLNLPTQIVGAVFAMAFSCTALAQAFPSRPIRMIVPFPPGGGGDMHGRAVAQKLSESLGQPVVVDNKPGAGGSLGLELAARAAPDGYTLVLAVTSNFAINPALREKPPYDPVKDFTPIALLSKSPMVLVTPSSSAFKTMRDVIDMGKAKPGAYTVASAGNGTVGHLSSVVMKLNAGVELLHVPFNGASPALTGLLGRQIDLYFASMPSAMPHVKTGDLRALGVTSTKRVDAYPNLPTLAEAGLQDFEATNWYGLLAPAGMPSDITAQLHKAVMAAVVHPDVARKVADEGGEVSTLSNPEFARFAQEEVAKWAKAVKLSGMKLQ